MMKLKRTVPLILALGMVLFSFPLLVSQDVKDMDRQARKYLADRQYSKAINLWLQVLEIDPENESAHRQIEYVYEIKQRKDLALQRAKLNFRLARRIIRKNFSDDDIDERQARRNLALTLKRSDVAFDNYETAMKIDPRDPEARELLDDMKRLEALINAEKDRQRMALALQLKLKRLKKEAKKLEDEEKYEDALAKWREVLRILPRDRVAKDGERRTKLAVENRLKFEKIKEFIARGKTLFTENKFQPARLQFEQALVLDQWNREARDYIDRIEEKLNEKKLKEQRLRQAEEFYVAGLKNIRAYEFDQARDNLENVLALVKNYRDTEEKLASLDRLKKEYLKQQREKKLRRINEEFQSGLIALSEGRYSDAVAAFEITLRLDPDNKLAKQYIERAKTALKQQREEQVDENSPYFNIVNSLIVSGRNLYDQGKYRESREKWDRILELFPKNRIATEYLLRCNIKMNPGSFNRFAQKTVQDGRELLTKKNFKEALRKFELVQSISKNYPGIDRLIAQARREGNRAVVRGNQPAGNRIQASPAQVNARYNRAVAFYQRGGRANLERALADFRWVVSADPNNIKALVSINRIEAQLRVGVTQVAGAGANRLTAQQRARVRRLYYNGISFYSNNNFQAAINEWRKVLAIDPNHVKAKNNIRKVLALIGR